MKFNFFKKQKQQEKQLSSQEINDDILRELNEEFELVWRMTKDEFNQFGESWLNQGSINMIINEEIIKQIKQAIKGNKTRVVIK